MTVRRSDIATALAALASFSPSLCAQLPETYVERPGLSVRQHTASAWDSARERVVLFGGRNSYSCRCDTWEWDGEIWIERHPINSPCSRERHAMAYDAARQRVVLYGGRATGSVSCGMTDTWEWDGSEWTRFTTAVNPGFMTGAAMVYDPIRQRTMMFGGLYTDETWEWDGAAWTLRNPTTRPPARQHHAMAWDAVTGRVLMFGGQLNNRLGDTWAWNGTNWTQLQPANAPSARLWHAMAADPRRGRIVMFGGFVSPGDDTWEWDGTNWLQRAPMQSPPAVYRQTMAFDGRNGQVLMAFGVDNRSAVSRNETWLYDGVTWTLRGAEPFPFRFPDAVDDTARGRVVMYVKSEGSRERTWEWAGQRWEPRVPRTSTPTATGDVGLAYHSGRQRVMLFGGAVGTSSYTDELWEWDGVDWTRLSQATRPPARSFPMLTYDLARDRLVLFGGRGASGPLGDTWEWDGASWRQLAPTTRPPAAARQDLVYDVARGVCVAYGDFAPFPNIPSQTWEWDGVDWLQRHPATVPTTGFAFRSMTYDPMRGKVVLVVAMLSSPVQTWEWDGTDWSRLTLPQEPHSTIHIEIAADSARQRLIVFTDDEGSSAGNTTWLLGRTSAATQQLYGAGCAGGAGVPFLAPLGLPTLGNTAFGFDVGSAPANSPAAVMVARGRASLPFGPCTILVDPVTSVGVPLSTNASGFGELRLQIPGAAALIGASLWAQGAVLDPAGAFGLGTLTNGVQLTIGD